MQRIPSRESLDVRDFLQLIKTIRNRLLKYVPVIRDVGMEKEVQWKRMHDLLGLSPVLPGRTGTGKMRDAHPLALFRLCHVIALFRKRLRAEAVYRLL
jgi:hypothetical protein